MARCAVVDNNNIAVNVIVAEPTCLPPDNCQLIELQPDQAFDIGWIWDGVNFSPANSGGNE